MATSKRSPAFCSSSALLPFGLFVVPTLPPRSVGAVTHGGGNYGSEATAASASAQGAGRHEVEEPERGAVRGGDRARGRLSIHHAGGIARVVEAERVADLVAEDAADGARGEEAARAVVVRDVDARDGDPE